MAAHVESPLALTGPRSKQFNYSTTSPQEQGWPVGALALLATAGIPPRVELLPQLGHPIELLRIVD